MSWTQELYKVYEQQCGMDSDDGKVLLPVSHSTANAQIEVTLKQDGSFVSARQLEDGKNTIIPVSAASGKRSGRFPPPHPFADKLFYLAGDADQYFDDSKYGKFYQAYIDQLEKWNNSQYTHPAVSAVYSYLTKRTLLGDLIESNCITIKEKTADNQKTISQFVRFVVQYTDLFAESRTWLDQSLYNCYIEYALSLQSNAPSDLCYATGKHLPIMDNTEHSKQIIPRCANAKLICINNQPLTYAGRFLDDKQALRVSYDFSQKMHNALRWLIQRQGIPFDTMTLLVWTSSLTDPPDVLSAACDPDDDENFGAEIKPDTEPLYRDFLRRQIFGTKAFAIDSKVMLMGVDAATTGRLSVAMYEELEHSRLLEQLCKWHAETSVLRFYAKQKVSRPNSFAVREIINCAYGMENGKGFLEAKPETVKDNVLRLLPCITQGRHIPADIVQNLVKKASYPLAYEHSYNHRTVLETACGMIRRKNIEQKKGVTSMAYDPNETDRSYLFGCLLAIADAAEYASYDDADKGGRVTNAKRYWSMFASRPSTTWTKIESQLRVYMMKLGAKSIYYEKMLNDVMSKFDLHAFADNSPLTSAYLLGYHHFNAEIYKKKEED